VISGPGASGGGGGEEDVDAARERERRRLERELRRKERTGTTPPGGGEPVPPPPPAAEGPASRLGDSVRDLTDRARGPRSVANMPSGTASARWPWLTPKRFRLGLLGLIGLIVVIFLWALFQPFHGDGHGRIIVRVPKGDDAGQIADLLDSKGVISSGTLFEIRLTLAGERSNIQAGTYVMKYDMSYSDAIDELTHPPTVKTISATIPEGLDRRQVAPIVAKAGVRGSYEAASKSSSVLNPKQYGAKHATSLEGFLFPSTYELKPHATAKDLVAKQLQAFKQNISRVNMSYAKSKNLTVFDVLTIASMIEREVQVPRERPLVAAVIYNRLKRGEPLGIDSTTRYATGNYTSPLTNSELSSNSPYNTRNHPGLPPGPIGNPGLSSIQAAANPAKVGYLYFVVKPGTCGEHTFATTSAEFDRAQAAYNNAREAKGGSPTKC
jgi:uncharacterized YceG family protein